MITIVITIIFTRLMSLLGEVKYANSKGGPGTCQSP